MSSIPEKFFKEEPESLYSAINETMNYLDSLHVSCHEVEVEDAHNFYKDNPYMHECIDKLIHGVNNVRFSLASIPKERWFTVE